MSAREWLRSQRSRSYGDGRCNAGVRLIAAGNARSTTWKRPTETRNICSTRYCSGPGRFNFPASRKKLQRPNTLDGFRRTWARLSTKQSSTRAGSNRTKNGMQPCTISFGEFWIPRRGASSFPVFFRSFRRSRGLERLIRSPRRCSS